jgi:hypothetical protein
MRKNNVKYFLVLGALTLLIPLAASAQVVITEIMYHPLSDENGDEFVEIYNAGGVVQDLSNWCFDGIEFCFDPGASIAVGQYLVLATDATQFQATYGFPPDHVYLLELNDNGERLSLLDGTMVVQDEVIYDDGGQWPVTPDGLGPSLELIDPALDNSVPRNWHASSANGGTPGALNSVDQDGLPPWIENVQHTANVQPSDPVVVTATVLDATSVQLTYLIDFGTESSVAMLDDGASNDGDPGDGVYGASIPGQPDGSLVRYRITATGTGGTMTYPREDDTVTYDGTAVIDSALTSSLPILHWFIDPQDYQDAWDHKFTDETEPAVLYYDGKLYDGIEIRFRGQSARVWPKPPWKFIFPQGHNFEAPDLLIQPVDNFNLQSNYSDKTYMREILAWESLRDIGAPWLQASPVRVQQNGQFFGLFNVLEMPDQDWIRRMRFSQTGARYKAMGHDMSTVANAEELEDLYEKKTRLDEDYTDLFDLIVAINTLSGSSLENYLFDNVNIPAIINYHTLLVVSHNNDWMRKNHYLYRDTDGTGRWEMFPWDLDLTFGRNWVDGSLNDIIWADTDWLPGLPEEISPSHPLIGTSVRKPYQDTWHRLVDRVLLTTDDLQEMHCRRLRSVMDLLLVLDRYEDRIDELEALFATEAEADRQKWGQYGVSQDLATAVTILKEDYLNPRRVHLYGTHGGCLVPAAQPPVPRVVINEIMYNPTGGELDEFVELYNPSTVDAVDISGWRLDGLALRMPAGTVIPPEGFALLVKNDVQFRTTYGSGLFVPAQYEGSLDDLGESLVLRNQNGGVISSVYYDAASPWPAAANGGGSSLELIDASQDTGKVVNWAASAAAGGTPGSANSAAGTISPVPALFINEVLPDNATINQDEMGDYDPWIEIYNASAGTIDLGGMYLSNDLGVSDMWQIPASTDLCAGCWMIFWADAETGEGSLHTNFTLSPTGGSVALFSSGGQMIDYLNYGALATDASFGRFPDGGYDLRIFSIVTPGDSNDVPPVAMILNEYSAVDDLNYLDNLNSDTYWGRIEGNGGDWFEIVVTMDHVDARGWQFQITNDTAGAGETSYTLTLSSDLVWSDLRAGTVITVSEQLADDVSFDPESGDWWINVQAADGASGLYITAQDFEVTNNNWQLTIKDDLAQTVFGPAGEGVWPLSGIGSDEVYKLEEDPGPYVTPVSDYNDGTSSTFGSPNIYSGGSRVQDFSSLREVGILGECSGPDTDTDGWCDSQDNCPTVPNPSQSDGDGDGVGDACDTCLTDPYNDADEDGHCADADNCPATANAGQEDADTDGVGDVCDNCPSHANAGQDDDDSDNLGDACDPCPGDPLNDPDSDGICGAVDNCPSNANAGQEDADTDGKGDVCDPCPNDRYDDLDLDGFCADLDNCPVLPNVTQVDADSDDVGDICDNCASDANTSQTDTNLDGQGDACDDDDDGDGLLDGPDNCQLIFNPDQADTDSDGQGDACDGDDDADGILDDADNCPLIPNAGQPDADSDSAGDACDCQPANKSVAAIPDHVGPTLRMDKTGGGTLTWAHGPQGHVSQVYRGSFTSGAAWAYDETCLIAGIAETVAVDATDPATPGTGFYYLIAGINVCGEGPAGMDSQGNDIHPAATCGGGSGDADSDGVDDYLDNCSTEANATQDDPDRDFFGDLCDNCPGASNPDQADLNLDGEGDACDDDDDGDGVTDEVDNCPVNANTDQADADSDGEGDVCDLCTDADSDGLGEGGTGGLRCPPDPFFGDPENDADGDDVNGVTDNCPDTYNPDQFDADGDGLGDECDPCPMDPINDSDGDGICAGSCDLVDLAVVQFASPVETTLLEAGASMKYLFNMTDPGIGMDWTAEAYDDSQWNSGTYGVGYEATGGAENLLATTVELGSQSVYTRATFEITSVGDVDDLWLGADYDDGYVAWINGVEVYRSPEVPAGALTWDTSPNSHECSNGTEPDYGQLNDISAAALGALHDGTNVLAIAVLNRIPINPPSSDLVLVPKLAMNRQPTMAYMDNQTDPLLGLTWKDEAFDDSSWSTGTYGVGYDGMGEADGLIQTTTPSMTYSIYTRARFTVEDAAIIRDVWVGADYDDGYVAWINGVEVYRSPEMPDSGDPLWNTAADLHECSNGTEPDFGLLQEVSSTAVPVIHTGVNVLAVGVWNNRESSSDLVLVPTLATNGMGVDNCPLHDNPSQSDVDNDGIGDDCDNCPAVFNPVQIDSDGNGTGDACEPI